MNAIMERTAASPNHALTRMRHDYSPATNMSAVAYSNKPLARSWNSLRTPLMDLESGWAKSHATNARHSNEVMVFIYGHDMSELVLGGVPTRDWREDLNILATSIYSSHSSLRAAAFSSPHAVVIGDVLDDVKWLKENFSLSMSEMAGLFNVTRKAVYDWFDGSRPRQQMSEKIACVREILEKGIQKEHRRFVRQFWNTRGENGAALIDVLKAQEFTSELAAKGALAIDNMAPKIAQYIERNQSTRQRHAIGHGNTDDSFRSIESRNDG